MELISWKPTQEGDLEVVIRLNKPIQGLEEEEALKVIRTLDHLVRGTFRREFENAFIICANALRKYVF